MDRTSKQDREAIWQEFSRVLAGWSGPGKPEYPSDGSWMEWFHPDGHRIWWSGSRNTFGLVEAGEFNTDLYHGQHRGKGWLSRTVRDLVEVLEEYDLS